MSNLSYCRFQNTVPDLSDCADALEEIGGDLTELSQDEAQAADRLIQLCHRITSQFPQGEN
jgi:hypothetical protein